MNELSGSVLLVCHLGYLVEAAIQEYGSKNQNDTAFRVVVLMAFTSGITILVSLGEVVIINATKSINRYALTPERTIHRCTTL